MGNITSTEHDEELLAVIEEERALMRTLRERERKLIGHMLRKDSLLRTTIKI